MKTVLDMRDTVGLERCPKTEVRLARIWADALGVAEVAPDQNFFELGGDSLLATEVALTASVALNRDLPLTCVISAPTVAEMAQLALAKGRSIPGGHANATARSRP